MKQVYDYNAQISFVKEFKKGGIRVCYPFLFHKVRWAGGLDVDL